MATPSSSATSPSPPMAYIPHLSTPSQATPSPTTDVFERDDKKKSVQKFIARAELSSFTRSLRNRLAYASHKTPGLSRYSTMRDADQYAQPPGASSPFARSNAARRKAPAPTNFYTGTAPNGVAGMPGTSSPMRRGGPGSSSSMTGFGSRSNAPGSGDPGMAGRQGVSLFTSILAPPPPQQARTILNANDPPVAAPLRPEPSPRAHGQGVVRSIAEGTRAHSKSKHPDTGSTRRKGKARSSKHARDVDADGDVDMKAAQTLTSLLMQHRPSVSGSASSPRSSFDGSDAGSTQPYPRYAQSSATRGASSQGHMATSSNLAGPSYRDRTPPQHAASQQQSSTPRPAPTDDEAADLMLFLATSPSPARPSKDVNNAKDQAAFRALGGPNTGGLRAKGRVLFPNAPGEPTNKDTARASHRGTPSGLARGNESSFTSSISSIGSDIGRRDPYPSEEQPRIIHRANTPSQLLPPPALPPHSSVPSSPSGLRKSFDASPRPSTSSEFNIHEYIHASPGPSPSRGHLVQPGQHKVNQGLRADVGRKLFEGEQMRLGMTTQSVKRHDDRSLGAGIDLLKS